MNYYDLVGGYVQAYQNVLDNGGQLYPGRGKQSASVVVQGKNCYTYWPEGSKRRREVQELSAFFNLDSHGKTGGRLARWLIDTGLGIPYKGTYWSAQYRQMAKSGHHWHYSYVEPNKHFVGLEMDIKSAYTSSLLAGKSLLYHPSKGYLPDNNALENLSVLLPDLPKWFRLQLLGCLSTWQITFLARSKDPKKSLELELKSYKQIPYGAAFNATHRAIYRNYKIMERIHKIGGEYIKRMHTDSFMLDVKCPRKVAEELKSYILDKGLRLDVKRTGLSYFFDLNTGFCGKQFIGAAIDVMDSMKQANVKMQDTSYPPELVDVYGDYLVETAMCPSKGDKPDTESFAKARHLELVYS